MIEIELNDYVYSPSFISVLVGLLVYILMYMFYDTSKSESKTDKRKRSSRDIEEDKVKGNDNETRIIVASLSALATWILLKAYDMYFVQDTVTYVSNVNDNIVDIRPNRAGIVDIRDGTIGAIGQDNTIGTFPVDGNTNGNTNNNILAQNVSNVINSISEEDVVNGINNIRDVVNTNATNTTNPINPINQNLAQSQLHKMDSNYGNVMSINTRVPSARPNINRPKISRTPRIPSKSITYSTLGNGLAMPDKALPMID